MHRPANATLLQSAEFARLVVAPAIAITLIGALAGAGSSQAGGQPRYDLDSTLEPEHAPTLLVHSWYESECCDGGDCHPVPCEELGRDAHDNVTFDDYRFRGTQIRPSKDAHCHVCFHDYYGGIMRRPICVYVQNGT